VQLPTRGVFRPETPSKEDGSVPSLMPGPKVAAKKPATSTHPYGPVASEPGSPPGSRTGDKASPPDSATAWAATETCGAGSVRCVREPTLRVASRPRVKDAAGDGQVPGPGHKRTTLHKNPPGKQNLGGVPTPCNEKHTWEFQAPHPCPKLQAGQPAC